MLWLTIPPESEVRMTANTMNAVVVRTERGLTVRGTRLTLYLLMDCINAGWSDAEIKECYSLTDEEYAAIVTYITEHRAEFEEEYQLVLRQAAANRRYWDERNRAGNRFAAEREQDENLASFAARLRGELQRRDVERINQHAERLNCEMDEVLVYQTTL